MPIERLHVLTHKKLCSINLVKSDGLTNKRSIHLYTGCVSQTLWIKKKKKKKKNLIKINEEFYSINTGS